jgi:type IV fimbrial biogenesis protein FimT
MFDYNIYGLSRFHRRPWPILRPVRDAGLSLIEVILVVAILAVAGAVTIPHLIDWRHGLRLRAAVNELRSDLVAAKTRAARENAQVTVQFLPAEGRYRITFFDPNGQPVLVKDQELPIGVRMADQHPDYTFDSKSNRTSFGSRGTADPGTLVLQNDRGKTASIVINFLGRIDVRS